MRVENQNQLGQNRLKMFLLIFIIVLNFLIIFPFNGSFGPLLDLIDKKLDVVLFGHKRNSDSHFFVFLRGDSNLLLFGIVFDIMARDSLLKVLRQSPGVIFKSSFLVEDGNHLNVTKDEPLDHVSYVTENRCLILGLKIVHAERHVT